MATYHINANGDAGACRATVGSCPFGDAVNHYDSAEAAREAYEAKQEAWDWRVTRESFLKALELNADKESDDYFEIELEGEGRVLTTMRFRTLPGKRIWPQWRENHYHPLSPSPPKGVHAELQKRVLEMLPGWSMISSPLEMSPEAKAFRQRFLERNPDVTWELDKELEGDEGVPEATPRMGKAEATAQLKGTPFAELFAE